VFISALFLVALAAPPAVSTTPPAQRVLVLDVEVVGTDAVDAAAATRVMAAAAAEVPGYTVLSTADLRAMANLEVDRQNAGCTTTGCLTELADALGAGLVLFGTVSTIGDTTTTTVTLYASETQALQKRSFTSSTNGLAKPLRAETITLLGGRAPRSPAVLVTGIATAALGAAAAGIGTWQVMAADAENKDLWLVVGRAGVVAAAAGVVVGVVGAVLYVVE
jgi:hypothetical protein